MIKHNRKKYFREVAIAFFLVILPFVLFAHLFFDNTADYVIVFRHKYFHGFVGSRAFVWTILSHIIPIVFLTIWFLECSYKWKWIILILLSDRFFYVLNNLFYYPEIIENHLTIFILISIGIYFFFLMLINRSSHKIQGQKNTVIKLRNYGISFKNSVIYSLISFRNTSLDVEQIPLTNLVHIDSVISKEILSNKMHRRNPIYFIDIIIIICLISTILIKNSEILIPEEKSYIHILKFKISSVGFLDVKTLVYVVSNKLSNLFFLFIWLITYDKWYRYALLSPLLMIVYQIWELFQPTQQLDELSLIYVLPWIIGLASFIILIAIKINYVNLIMEYKTDIGVKMNNLIMNRTNDLNKPISETLNSQDNGYYDSQKHNLDELIKLKQQLEDKLKK